MDAPVFFLFAFAIAIYFIPTIIAVSRAHHQVGPITVVNLLFGWSFLGWVIAFAWSVSATFGEAR